MSGFLDWLYPENCVCFICAREAHTDSRGICESCAQKLYPAEDLRNISHLDGFYAAVFYDELMAGPIHALKYDDARYMGKCLSRLMKIPEEWKADALVPVPLSKKKQHSRGYNQSELIADALSEQTGIPVDTEMLFRVRDTGTQTALGARERILNMRGAFQASPRAEGRRVILIDDVVTTGATLRECAKMLRLAGADKVYGASACSRGL